MPQPSPPAADAVLADFALLAEQQPSAPATFIDLPPAVDAVTADTPEAEPPHPSWDAAVALVVWAAQPDADDVDAVIALVAAEWPAQLPVPAAL
jgi:hypothetical protein